MINQVIKFIDFSTMIYLYQFQQFLYHQYPLVHVYSQYQKKNQFRIIICFKQKVRIINLRIQMQAQIYMHQHSAQNAQDFLIFVNKDKVLSHNFQYILIYRDLKFQY
ncbi:hypothetical protein TTHERM_000379049 (macronuclear) [Tetrahymena thermophila SB210]|uniref:Uncharacterized protein n=1 Tax=Tetrahymena thermophila (strain SB210) TaxID=312017 RepID=W7X544_TETTS|nr:hypothetical protein TTHERM_000379049 [Tetrahymena thermophila SB210]EWS74485.1 hypothetical protein TTHERM_000379049 [Tetrahymena thermophila SB210]|eukprot:XP_012652970.1 hypothetical protein TTHERM_000379049 [Tetrahymena thermophila SB210]